jgi:hypothetical protein
VIDDLTEEEFDVLTAVLGRLFVLNERFPKEPEVIWNDALRNFLSARRSPGSAGLAEPVMWSAPRTYRSPDGTYFESLNLVLVPGAVCYDWGTEEEPTEQEEEAKYR